MLSSGEGGSEPVKGDGLAAQGAGAGDDSMHGAEIFCAIRSYLATATRHGIGWLDALPRAADGHPWIPGAA